MILKPKRYEIYFADLDPTTGSEISKVRPVVVISQDEMNLFLETVVICPLTSKLHTKWRSRLQVIWETGRATPSPLALKVMDSLNQPLSAFTFTSPLAIFISQLSNKNALKFREKSGNSQIDLFCQT